MATRDPRIEQLRTGLLPIVRIEGEDVRYRMEDRLAAYGCPAVGVAVMDGGVLAWSEGFGHLHKGGDQPADADTMFAGASISKPVTAALALQLVERGVFDLDTDVNTYLKTWKIPENEFTRQSPVTLRWLLSHKAGTTVHGFGGVGPGSIDDVVTTQPTVVDMLEGRVPGRMSGAVRVDKVPGGTVRYSGGGTMIVQLMLEEATGKPFAELAEEKIFAPLGMTRTTFRYPLPDRFRANAAWGHDTEGGIIPEKWTVTPESAAGGIYTTAGDYARFMLACRDAWLGKPGGILGQAIATEMMTPQGGEFGLGWIIVGEGKQKRFTHGGSCEGYQCETSCYLEDGKGGVVLTNAVSGLQFYWEVLNAIADMYQWNGFMPAPKKIVPIPRSDFDRYAGTYEIVSGVDAPFFRIWEEGGVLRSEIKGMRGGPRDVLMDQNGYFFNRVGPYETHIIYDADGRASELVVYLSGATEIMRARRAS